MKALRVGFIGLGNCGGPMARHIIEAGFPTTLWARRPESLAPFASMPVTIAPSPAELAAAVDLVGVCTWDDESVEDVLHGEDGVLAGAQPGTVVAIHSTVRPDLCTRLAAEAAERGIVLIDAPVSGGQELSEAGQLLVMMGGPTDAVERCRPIFRTFGGAAVLHMGDVGAAQLAKLVNNTLLAANAALANSAIEVGQRVGIDPDVMLQVILNGSGRSFGANILDRARPIPPRVTLTYWNKDVHLLVDTVESLGADATSVLVDLAQSALGLLRDRCNAAEESVAQG